MLFQKKQTRKSSKLWRFKVTFNQACGTSGFRRFSFLAESLVCPAKTHMLLPNRSTRQGQHI